MNSASAHFPSLQAGFGALKQVAVLYSVALSALLMSRSAEMGALQMPVQESLHYGA